MRQPWSYHAGGIQYNQYPGELGLGWSIGATGYRVTRTVNNKPDETSQHVDMSYISDYYMDGDPHTNAMRDTYLTGLSRRVDPERDSPTGMIARNYNVDGEYDLFTYMAPTTNNRFILDVDLYSTYLSAELATIDDSRDKFSVNGVELPRTGRGNISKQLRTFKIVDDTGNQFYYGSQNEQFVETTYEGNEFVRGSYGTFPSSWVLEKAITPNNDIVNFAYTTFSISDVRPSTSRKIMIYDDTYYSSNNEGASTERFDTDLSPSISHSVKMVNTISTAHETLTISRETTGDERGRIKEITVKSKANNAQLRRIVFTYENGYNYLLSNIVVYGSDNVNGKTYRFDYHDRNATGSFYPDHWGYNTPNSQFDGFHREFLSDSYVRQWYSNRPSIFTYSTSYSNYFRTDRKRNDRPSRLSLKRINYPTGGYTEYNYESHRYFDTPVNEVVGGGLRIQKIISNPNDGTPPLATEYQYATGIPTFNLNHRDFNDEQYTVTGLGLALTYSLQVKRIYSTTPLGDLSWGLFSVYYPKVTKLEYAFNPQTGTTTSYNGKTVSEYSAGSLYGDGDGIYNIGTLASEEGCYNAGFVNIGYPYPRYIKEYNYGAKPRILNRSYFNNNDKKLMMEEYTYVNAGFPKIFEGLKINQRLFFNSAHLYTYYLPEELRGIMETDRSRYLWIINNYIDPLAFRSSFFDYGSYRYKISHKLLSRKKTTAYDQDGNNPVEQREDYIYDNLNRLEMKEVFNNTDREIVYYTYPDAYSGTVYANMKSKNMIATPVRLITYANGEEHEDIKTNYGQSATQTKNLILPVSVQGNNYFAMKTQITYDLYDEKGNLLQYTEKDGIPVSYLWSYNYLYPVAEIKNATYSQVSSALTSLGLNAASLASNVLPDATILNSLKVLSSRLSTALVTVYTYKPLIGVESVTDTRGVTTYYDYDSFGRLKESYFYEDSTKRIVEQYQYNYRN